MEHEAEAIRQEIEDQKDHIQQLLEDHPELVAPGATLSKGFGILAFVTQSPLTLIKEYYDNMPESSGIGKKKA